MPAQMKCPDCGRDMAESNDGKSWKCHDCGVTSFVVESTTFSLDVANMSPKAFADNAIVTSTIYTVRFVEDVNAPGVDSVVINKKIADAYQYLENGDWRGLNETLKSIPQSNLPVIDRLRLLAYYKVKNEGELFNRSINLRYDSAPFCHIVNSNIVDIDTKQTYQAMEQSCNDNLAADKEIEEGNKLLKAGLMPEFAAYAQDMCNKYPVRIRSWLLLANAYSDDEKQINRIYEIIKKLPDFPSLADDVVTHDKYCRSYAIPDALKDIIYNNDDRIIRQKDSDNAEKRFGNILRHIPIAIGLIFSLLMYLFADKIKQSSRLADGLGVLACVVLAIIIIVPIVIYNTRKGEEEKGEKKPVGALSFKGFVLYVIEVVIVCLIVIYCTSISSCAY